MNFGGLNPPLQCVKTVAVSEAASPMRVSSHPVSAYREETDELTARWSDILCRLVKLWRLAHGLHRGVPPVDPLAAHCCTASPLEL